MIKKKESKTLYCCKREFFCLPKPSCCPLAKFWNWCRGCDDCGCHGHCPQCSHVRCKHVLLKKVVTCEVPDFACKVIDPLTGKDAATEELPTVQLGEPRPGINPYSGRPAPSVPRTQGPGGSLVPGGSAIPSGGNYGGLSAPSTPRREGS
jgi:hypothetical protein